MIRGRQSLSTLALAGWLVFAFAGCSEKARDVGGESHFVCASDDDCDEGSVCLPASGSSTRRECRPIRGVDGGGMGGEAQGAVTFKVGVAPGKTCSHTNGQVSIPLNVAGVFSALNCDLTEGCRPDEFVAVDRDRDRGTNVTCSVRSNGGSFDVSLSLAFDGTLTGDPSLQFQANGALSPTGGTLAISEANSVSGGGGSDSACSVTVDANHGRLEAGTTWAKFHCDDFRDPSDISETGCIADGIFLFQKCSR